MTASAPGPKGEIEMNQQDRRLNSEQEEYRQTAGMFTGLLGATLGMYLFLIFTAVYNSDSRLILLSLIGTAFQIVPFVMVRKGNFQAGSVLVVLSAILMVTTIATIGHGIHDLVLVAYPIIFVFAGFTLNRSFVRFCFGLTLAAIGWLFACKAWGWFTPAPLDGQDSNWINFATVVLLLFVAAFAVDTLGANMRRNLGLARQEIVQRKQADAEREQFYKFFTLSSDIMVIADPLGAFKKVNPTALEILGYSEAELITKPFIDFVHPDDKQLTSDEMARQMKIGSSLNFENRYMCKDGTIRWLAWRAYYDRDDGITYATARDITELKLSEQALRNASEYNRSLIEASLDPLVTIGPDGKITDVNSATERVTGRARAELVGTDFSVYFTEPGQARAGYEQVFSEGAVHDYPLEILHRDGHKTSVLYNAAIYRDTDGSEIGVFAAARDVTERKLVEHVAQTRARLFEFSQDHSLDELLTATLDEVEELTGSLVGFYHFLEEDQVTLSLQNWSTRTLRDSCTAAGKGRRMGRLRAPASPYHP